jgi:hypothetical protein
MHGGLNSGDRDLSVLGVPNRMGKHLTSYQRLSSQNGVGMSGNSPAVQLMPAHGTLTQYPRHVDKERAADDRNIPVANSNGLRPNPRGYPIGGPVGGSRLRGSMSREEENMDSGQARRRIAVACARCRKRKIRCSGDPGDGTGCNSCKGAGVDVNVCQFHRVGPGDASRVLDKQLLRREQHVVPRQQQHALEQQAPQYIHQAHRDAQQEAQKSRQQLPSIGASFPQKPAGPPPSAHINFRFSHYDPAPSRAPYPPQQAPASYGPPASHLPPYTTGSTATQWGSDSSVPSNRASTRSGGLFVCYTISQDTTNANGAQKQDRFLAIKDRPAVIPAKSSFSSTSLLLRRS